MEGSSSKPIRYFESTILLSRIMHLSSPNSRHYIVTRTEQKHSLLQKENVDGIIVFLEMSDEKRRC